MEKKNKRIKVAAEKGFQPEVEKEDEAITIEPEKKNYGVEQLLIAITDLSLKINNAYFKAPFYRCPNCNKSATTLLYFGEGGANKIGNLKGFNATVHDLIAWKSPSYEGISFVKSKDNGVFELETSPFKVAKKEPGIIERMVIPEMYRPILGEMAAFLAEGHTGGETDVTLIGDNWYPYAIAQRI